MLPYIFMCYCMKNRRELSGYPCRKFLLYEFQQKKLALVIQKPGYGQDRFASNSRAL